MITVGNGIRLEGYTAVVTVPGASIADGSPISCDL